MPSSMFLRSNWTATQIADPNKSFTLEAFQAATEHRLSLPVPLHSFVAYGLWYQTRAVPALDHRAVLRVEFDPRGFRLFLEDGEVLFARRVVMATGIAAFAHRPPAFTDVSSKFTTHSSEHFEFDRFRGKRVLVIGSGQSALESAALLCESGAEVEVIARSRQIHWLQGLLSRTLHHRLGKLIRNILYAPTDVGPAGISQLLARPDLVRKLPRGLQDRLRSRAVRPAGARWLVERLRAVPISLGCSVATVNQSDDKITVELSDGSRRRVNHVLLGTGYRVDIGKYKMLHPAIIGAIERNNGYPCLRSGLETSVPGLHILGAPAAWSFGPLMQFVSGTGYASRALLRSVSAKMPRVSGGGAL